MDHFPVFDTCYPPLRVPSLSTPGTDDFYDNQGFYGYPRRRGWGIGDEVSLRGRGKEETNIFLQSWLYFGFLSEAMSIIDVQFRMEEFIEDPPDHVGSQRGIFRDISKLGDIRSKKVNRWIHMTTNRSNLRAFPA
jgi:hypothetical protein